MAFGWNLFPTDIYCKIFEIVIPKLYGFVSMVPRKSLFFIAVKINRFGMVPYTESSIERDCDPLENVKVLSSTLVNLYLTRNPFLRVSL